MRSDLVTIAISAELAQKLEQHPLPRLAFERAVDRAIARERQRLEKRAYMARRRQAELFGWVWS